MSPFPAIPLAFYLHWSVFSGGYKIFVFLMADMSQKINLNVLHWCSLENPGTQGGLHILDKVTFHFCPPLMHFQDAVSRRWSRRPCLLAAMSGCRALSQASQGLQAPARLSLACLSPGSWLCRGLPAHPAVQSHIFLPQSLSSSWPDFQTTDFTQSAWWPYAQFPVFLLLFLQRQCHLFEIWFGGEYISTLASVNSSLIRLLATTSSWFYTKNMCTLFLTDLHAF